MSQQTAPTGAPRTPKERADEYLKLAKDADLHEGPGWRVDVEELGDGSLHGDYFVVTNDDEPKEVFKQGEYGHGSDCDFVAMASTTGVELARDVLVLLRRCAAWKQAARRWRRQSGAAPPAVADAESLHRRDPEVHRRAHPGGWLSDDRPRCQAAPAQGVVMTEAGAESKQHVVIRITRDLIRTDGRMPRAKGAVYVGTKDPWWSLVRVPMLFDGSDSFELSEYEVLFSGTEGECWKYKMRMEERENDPHGLRSFFDEGS